MRTRQRLNQTKKMNSNVAIANAFHEKYLEKKYPDKQYRDRKALKLHQVSDLFSYKRQINLLLKEYENNNYADKQSVDRIALKVVLTSKQVHNWFQNRRTKLNETKTKQLKLKITEALLEEYEFNKCPNKQSLARIALKVGLTSKQVYFWFHYRRNKRIQFNETNS